MKSINDFRVFLIGKIHIVINIHQDLKLICAFKPSSLVESFCHEWDIVREKSSKNEMNPSKK